MKEIRLQGCLEPGRLEAGCDEAGRGPLAGPVYAAAVILPAGFYHPLLNDSKQMTEKAREELRPIIEAEAVAWAVEAVQADEIDKLNILWASVTGMQRAVLRLDPAPDFLLVDGNKFRPFGRYGFKDFRTVVHGDATFASIAAASVLAKVTRDRLMLELAKEYPQYHFEQHKGYGTKLHYEALREYGPSPVHRPSFLRKMH